MWYCVILFTVFYLFSPYLEIHFDLFFPAPMDIESHAAHIRDILSRHAPQDQRRILHDLLTAVPEQEGPSWAKSDNHLRILGALFSLPFSLMLAIPNHLGTTALNADDLHGSG